MDGRHKSNMCLISMGKENSTHTHTPIHRRRDKQARPHTPHKQSLVILAPDSHSDIINIWRKFLVRVLCKSAHELATVQKVIRKMLIVRSEIRIHARTDESAISRLCKKHVSNMSRVFRSAIWLYVFRVCPSSAICLYYIIISIHGLELWYAIRCCSHCRPSFNQLFIRYPIQARLTCRPFAPSLLPLVWAHALDCGPAEIVFICAKW